MMTTTRRIFSGTMVALSVVLAAVSPAAAQGPLPPEPDGPGTEPGPALTILAGSAGYRITFDADEGPAEIDGRGPVVGAGLDLPLASWFFLEPRLTRLTLTEADAGAYGGESRSRWSLEFNFRGELAVGPAVPYLAVGVGGFFHLDEERPSERDFVTASYSVAGGVRVPLTSHLEVRGEARYRTFDDTASRVTPLIVALGWRF